MKHFTYFLFFLLTLGFTACEKEADHYAPAEALTPEERFERMQKPLVLYQFAVRQLESGQENGWLIDRDGWVRTYQRSYAPGVLPSTNNVTLAEVELEYLYGAASEGIFQLEKGELYEYLLRSNGLHQNQLSDPAARPGEPLSQAFYAYTQRTKHVSIGQGSEGGCNGGGNEYVQITDIHRSVVDVKGPESRFNSSAKGQAIHQWLLIIQEELNNKMDQ
jgi:hypothetical protein